MQFKQYSSYKNSGVEWLGDVPEHWDAIPSKFYFIERKEKAESSDKQLTASQKHGIIFQEDFMAENGRVMVVMKNPEILKKVRPNDFVISMRSFQGGLELSYLEGSISSAYVMLKPNLNVVDIEYYKYLFKTPRYIQSLQSTSNLIRDGQALRFNNFSQVKLVLPPKSDQQKIVAFLDTETARIDNLIAKQEKLIELLEEQRKSIISHAVTKGLNPNAPMKDSGVEWLGDVPEHWEVKKIKRISPVNRGASPRPINDLKYFDDNGEYAWVRISDVTRSNGFLFETEQRLSSLGASFSVKLEPESLFLSIAATVGKPCITKIKTCIHDGFVYFPKLNKHRDLLFNIFESKLCFVGLGKLGTQLNLNSETVEDIYVAIPPESEEKAILGYIQTETTRIDNLISKQKSLIEKLKEYRASIISHAVTGKIDVMEFGA